MKDFIEEAMERKVSLIKKQYHALDVAIEALEEFTTERGKYDRSKVSISESHAIINVIDNENIMIMLEFDKALLKVTVSDKTLKQPIEAGDNRNILGTLTIHRNGSRTRNIMWLSYYKSKFEIELYFDLIEDKLGFEPIGKLINERR